MQNSCTLRSTIPTSFRLTKQAPAYVLFIA